MVHHNRSHCSTMSGNQVSGLVWHMREFIGKTVTIFTTSGGASGNGFTGVIMSVNSSFVRLVIDPGSPPANPLNDNAMDGMDSGIRGIGNGNLGRNNNVFTRTVGSVVDIPVNRIAAFTHNAI